MAGVNEDSKIHGANMGPTWVMRAPGEPHGGPTNLAIWDKQDTNRMIFTQTKKLYPVLSREPAGNLLHDFRIQSNHNEVLRTSKYDPEK